MEDFARRHAEVLAWRSPAAGPVGRARLAHGSASAHAEHVRGGALLVPGPLFDLPDTHLRVGLGRESFPAALERWEAALG